MKIYNIKIAKFLKTAFQSSRLGYFTAMAITVVSSSSGS